MRHFLCCISRAGLRGPLGILGLLILFLLPGAGTLALVPTAHADIGPKPSADFEFKYAIERVPIVDGQLLVCDDKDCTQSHPLEQVGPQRFTCSADSCTSLAYGYGRYLKLVITFEDRVRESNVFEKRDFEAKFIVTVTQSGLKVREKTIIFTGGFVFALIFTPLSETLAASFFWRRYALPIRRLVGVPIASLITLPVIWLGFARWFGDDYLVVGLGEIFAVVFEAAFLYAINRGKLTRYRAAVISVVMNAVSFLLGLCAGVFLFGTQGVFRG
jgi:hypothetical protein